MYTFADKGNDVLEVTLTLDTGGVFTARGWVSALQNFHPPENYYPQGATVQPEGSLAATPDEATVLPEQVDVSGQLKPDAIPRQATADEAQAYADGLMREQHPELFGADAQAGKPLSFA